jgi:hypothetical protein
MHSSKSVPCSYVSHIVLDISLSWQNNVLQSCNHVFPFIPLNVHHIKKSFKCTVTGLQLLLIMTELKLPQLAFL